MPRALLSVSDKTGIVDLGARPRRPRLRTGVDRRHRARAGRRRSAGDQRLRRHRLSRNDGRPGEDAAPGDARRHPRAARSPRRSRGARARTASASIDVVVVNCIRSRRPRRIPATPFDALVEEIDIGGPSLVRAAAKNFRDVLVVVDPADYPRAARGARRRRRRSAFRFELMRKAFAHTAAYDTAIAATLATIASDGDAFERAQPPTATADCADAPRSVAREDARSALRREPAPEGGVVCATAGPAASGFGAATILQGKELSYTNLLDLDAAARIVLEFDEPAAVVDQAHQPVRRRDRRRRPPTRTCARARPTASPRSAASSR